VKRLGRAGRVDVPENRLENRPGFKKNGLKMDLVSKKRFLIEDGPGFNKGLLKRTWFQKRIKKMDLVSKKD
tara:strand:+ start:96 stop:308 length:213 start_codon:yes stop_codon:yes gene_type:complete